MATKIRFARAGSKKRPFYRMVVADVRAPRDGKFIEKLGTYNPLLDDNNDQRFIFNKDKVEQWLKQGAAPSPKAAILLFNSGVKITEKFLPKSYPKTPKEREEARKKHLEEKKAKELAQEQENQEDNQNQEEAKEDNQKPQEA